MLIIILVYCRILHIRAATSERLVALQKALFAIFVYSNSGLLHGRRSSDAVRRSYFILQVTTPLDSALLITSKPSYSLVYIYKQKVRSTL